MSEAEHISTAASSPMAARPPGLLHALANPSFALLAGATFVSNVGVWMRDTTSAWTVANDAHHHSAVALVQAATTIPAFLLALPAGVLADHIDRRRLLMWCQAVLALVGAGLAFFSANHDLTLALIILLAFVAGSASALGGPAFQAIVPSLVQRVDVASAVALSSISFNIARVIGPSVGGLLLAAYGPEAAYGVNAVAYGFVILALLLIKRDNTPAPIKSKIDFRAELREGLAFAGKSQSFQHILAHGLGLYFCAACYLTLTPLVAHDLLGRDPAVYGLLLAAIGIGSVAGGVLLSLAHRLGLNDDKLLLIASICGWIALVILAMATNTPTACFALALAGASTLLQLASLNAAAQLILPDAIRGRGLAIYMAATFGCMAVGNLFWGAVSDAFSIRAALALGAGGFLLLAFLGRFASVTQAVQPEAAPLTRNDMP